MNTEIKRYSPKLAMCAWCWASSSSLSPMDLRRMMCEPIGGVGTHSKPSSRTPPYHARTTLHAPSIRSKAASASSDASKQNTTSAY